VTKKCFFFSKRFEAKIWLGGGGGMTHTKSKVCRLAAGAFKRDAIPKSAGTVKKYNLFRKSELYLKK
jgi:hypothetical protein